ncbi:MULTISPECIES: MATE family efflux transporter [unclassified Clostridium]|jgi:putative MATE family efflux protein|uniref:MATE family efflux transporter n=1 Tax=unclassified Clostridium TaxID=2614128 RepID=UPI001C8C6B9F|nr:MULTISPECIES: MATE family efflux transporter [unclassified Clostridium]MBX9137599.1 MATE family efflux transporter [Clostridium sp. K12(2020)]MBX9144409.1 MATE family efflux transporter [Clostridium sp. K13]
MINTKVNLLKGNILKSLIVFAIPLLISNLFQQLYNTVDIMIVGNYLGDTSLAAIGASTAVYDLLVGFALGIGNGLSIVVARSYGADDTKLLRKSVAGSIIIGIFITIIIMVISKVLLMPLLRMLNTPVNIIEESYSYISMITLFVGVMFAYNLCAGLLRAIGNSFMPLIFLIISSLLNIVLDILFITKFNMGIKGAAVATIIAQGISVILCVIYIYLKTKILIPDKRHFNVGKELYKELLGQGLSMGLMMAIVSSGTVILQTAINGLGYLTIAGHTAARKLNSFCMMPIVAMSQSVSTFVSQNKGANQGERIRKSIYYSNLLAISWGIVITVVLFFIAPLLVKILSGSSEAIVINNGARYLRINSPFYGVLGILLNLRYSLQGLGKKILPLISSIIEFVGKIIFVILVIPRMNYLGVILCEPIIWCFMTAQLIYSFYNNPYIKKFKHNKAFNIA